MTTHLQGPANYDLDPGLCHSPKKLTQPEEIYFSAPGCPSRIGTAVHNRINLEKGVKLEAELTTTEQFSGWSQREA